MENTLNALLPQLIIKRGDDYAVCGCAAEVRLWLTPEVMENSSAFIVNDPGGYYLSRLGLTFRRGGYRLKVLDTANPAVSSAYNPFAYVRRGGDIPPLVSAFISGTRGLGRAGDADFLSAESLLLAAVFSYVADRTPDTARNIAAAIDLLSRLAPEPDAEFGAGDCELDDDSVLERLALKEPEHLASRKYRAFMSAADPFMGRVIDSCLTRLHAFGTRDSRYYFAEDQLRLDMLSHDRTALFVSYGNSPDFDFLVPLMYAQLFGTLNRQSVNAA